MTVPYQTSEETRTSWGPAANRPSGAAVLAQFKIGHRYLATDTGEWSVLGVDGAGTRSWSVAADGLGADMVIYVAPATGSDTNPGTLALPLATMETALQRAAAGWTDSGTIKVVGALAVPAGAVWNIPGPLQGGDPLVIEGGSAPEIILGAQTVSGAGTAQVTGVGAAAASLSVAGTPYVVDAYRAKFLRLLTGAGAGARGPISTNPNNGLRFEAVFLGAVANGDTFQIERPADSITWAGELTIVSAGAVAVAFRNLRRIGTGSSILTEIGLVAFWTGCVAEGNDLTIATTRNAQHHEGTAFAWGDYFPRTAGDAGYFPTLFGGPGNAYGLTARIVFGGQDGSRQTFSGCALINHRCFSGAMTLEINWCSINIYTGSGTDLQMVGEGGSITMAGCFFSGGTVSNVPSYFGVERGTSLSAMSISWGTPHTAVLARVKDGSTAIVSGWSGTTTLNAIQLQFRSGVTVDAASGAMTLVSGGDVKIGGNAAASTWANVAAAGAAGLSDSAAVAPQFCTAHA